MDALLWDEALAIAGEGFFVSCNGILRIALSCNITNDSLGNGELGCGCFPCARGDKGSDGLEACFERCHADFAAAGKCASCSASDILYAWFEVVDWGSEATIMSYADGARSTNEASNCHTMLGINALPTT